MVKVGSFSCVQPAERDGPEADSPDILVDLFEADVCGSKRVGDIHPDGVPVVTLLVEALRLVSVLGVRSRVVVAQVCSSLREKRLAGVDYHACCRYRTLERESG